MTRCRKTSPRARAAVLVFLASILRVAAIEITEGTHQGRAQFIVRGQGITWYYDRAGGGFSRVLDKEERDWIGFSKNPLNQFPASAAAGYRGIPNAVFVGPEKGAGHPGFDQCSSERVGATQIRTRSHSRKWQWSWSFTESSANFVMEKADPDHPWWFLYEGTIAGRYAPSEQYWGTSEGGPRREIPGLRQQRFGQWQWAYFGDTEVARILFVAQHDVDANEDTVWYLGSSEGGAASAPDGMVVAGFGRGPGTKALLRGAGQRFTIGFIDSKVQSPADHEKVGRLIKATLQGDGK